MRRLWEDVFVNQWAFAFGAQLTRGKMKYRLGYSYNTNPINHCVGDNLDGFPVARTSPTIPGGQHGDHQPAPHHRAASAGRISCCQLDLDLFAGGLFNATDEFGAPTQPRSPSITRHGVDLALRSRDLPPVIAAA